MTVFCKLGESFEECMEAAAKALARGRLIVYPTDTLYGIGANALDGKAVKRLLLLKGRGGKPISIIVHSLADVGRYCVVGERERAFMERIFPGPYTAILKKGVEFPDGVGTADTIGVRVPEHLFARVLSMRMGFPITATSANVSGERPPACAEEVGEVIASGVEVVVDGGRTKHGRESTVIDLTGATPAVLRRGAGYEEIAGFIAEAGGFSGSV